MATITPGTGGTCKATTAEGQLQEILTFISIKQASALVNPTEAQNVLAEHNQNSRVFSGSYRLPCTQALNTQGALVLTATPYLVGAGFAVGTAGTFKSNSAEGYALEVLMYLQSLELDPTKNTSTPPKNFISGTYNSDTGLYQGSFSIPIAVSLDAVSGAVEYAAQEYLLT